jgi:hypothetical protein
MSPVENLQSFLYVSDIADGFTGSTVLDIVTRSRTNNERDDISGLLVFDGRRFAQFVEGPPPPIEALLGRPGSDLRHMNMEVLWRASALGGRRFPSWRMGYLKFDLDLFGLEGLRGKRGEAVLEAFTFIIPTLDIDTGLAMPSQWGNLTTT